MDMNVFSRAHICFSPEHENPKGARNHELFFEFHEGTKSTRARLILERLEYTARDELHEFTVLNTNKFP
jgi:hypothetical protein